jgi:HTH-type transcriptional regulator/antitoxin HipB
MYLEMLLTNCISMGKGKEIVSPSKGIKTFSHEEVLNKFIGKAGTPKRDAFEEELRLDILSYEMKKARLERNLTQAQLGELVGVQKAQISKLEYGLTDARFDTILKVFKALNVKLTFSVELLGEDFKLA